MMDTAIRLISFLVYIFLLNFFFSSWATQARLAFRRVAGLVVLAGVVAMTAAMAPPAVEPFVNIAVTLAAMTVIASQYQVPRRDFLFWVVILLAINFISEALSLAIFDAILSTHYDATNLLFVIITTSLTTTFEILMMLALKLIFFRNRVIMESLNLPALMALTSIPVVSIVVLLSFLLAKINVEIQSTVFALLVAFGVLYMNLCVLYLYRNLTQHLRQIKQISLQNKSLAYELRYVSEMKKSQEQLAEMRHDLKNRFLVIRGLLAQNRTEEVQQYLQDATVALTVKERFYTRDAVLNYLLNDKRAVAEQAGIHVAIKVLLSDQINVENDILAVLFGNLIDNALEASKRLADPHEADISLAIKQFDDKLLIDIENRYDPQETVTRQARRTEGLGTSNIRRIVANYNGLYKQWAEGNRYFVSVILLNIN